MWRIGYIRPNTWLSKCELPGNRNGTITDKWYDVNGKEYTELPQSLDYSIMLYKNKKPEAEAARTHGAEIKDRIHMRGDNRS